MALAKLEFTPLDKDGKRITGKSFKVLFNPTDYAISKTVAWETPGPGEGGGTPADRRFNAPALTFGGGGSRQLTLNLFYDVTEPMNGVRVDDVRFETNKLVALTRIERDLGRPPVVLISWGQAPMGSDFPFTGAVSSLTQTFTLFTREGKPVRANVNVTLTEFLDPELDQRETDPELTTYRVRRGDTLSNIAAAVYQDPAQWRVIAAANRLDDPRRLEIGRILTIPDIA